MTVIQFIGYLKRFFQRLSLVILSSYFPTSLVLVSVCTVLFYVHPVKNELSFTPTLLSSTITSVLILSFTVLSIYFLVTKRYIAISRYLLAGSIIFFAILGTTSALHTTAASAIFGYALESGTILAFVSFFLTIIVSSIATYQRSTLWFFTVGLLLISGLFVSGVTLLPLLHNDVFNLNGAFSDTSLSVVTGLLILLAVSVIERSSTPRAVTVIASAFLIIAMYSALSMPTVYLFITITTLVYFCIFRILRPALFSTVITLPFTTLISTATLIVLMFIQTSSPLGQQQHLSYTQTPNFEESITVLSGVYRTNVRDAFLGTGANTYRLAWALHRPPATNETNYWNNEFATARTLLLTMLVESGILGTLVFVLLLAFIGLAFASKHSSQPRLLYDPDYQLISSLVFFSFAVLLLAKPSPLMLFITALGFGLATSSAQLIRVEGFLTTKRKFIFIQVTVYVVISVFLLALVHNNAQSVILFEKSVVALSQESDIESAKLSVKRAIRISPKPHYYRFMSQLLYRQVEVLLNSQGEVTEEDRENLRYFTKLALDNSYIAIDLERNHYLSWYLLGRIQTTLLMLGAAEAAPEGTLAYNSAGTLAPNSALVSYGQGEHAYLSGDIDSAKYYLQKSIIAKPDYAQAYALLNYIWEK